MTSKTPPSLAKPIPKTNTAAAALAFAEGGAAQQAKSEPPAPKPETVRLNANIPAELHRKLKMKAAREGTTIGELIEQWIQGLD